MSAPQLDKGNAIEGVYLSKSHVYWVECAECRGEDRPHQIVGDVPDGLQDALDLHRRQHHRGSLSLPPQQTVGWDEPTLQKFFEEKAPALQRIVDQAKTLLDAETVGMVIDAHEYIAYSNCMRALWHVPEVVKHLKPYLADPAGVSGAALKAMQLALFSIALGPIAARADSELSFANLAVAREPWRRLFPEAVTG